MTEENKEPWLATYKRVELEELKKFLHYLQNNSKRELTKISLNFKHRKFEDNKGFAILEMSHPHAMNSINDRIEKAVIEEIEELEKQIAQYGETGTPFPLDK